MGRVDAESETHLPVGDGAQDGSRQRRRASEAPLDGRKRMDGGESGMGPGEGESYFLNDYLLTRTHMTSNMLRSCESSLAYRTFVVAGHCRAVGSLLVGSR